MYQHNPTPLAMGVGGGSLLSVFEMPWFWVILAFAAIVAAGCAINRIIPKIWIVTNRVNNLDPDTVEMPEVRKHARL